MIYIVFCPMCNRRSRAFAAVDTIDSESNMPTLEDLRGYDAVLGLDSETRSPNIGTAAALW